MGGSGSALEDATLHPLPYDDRCFGFGGAVSAGSRTPSRTPIDNGFRSRPTVCVCSLATRVQPAGDRPKNVNSLSPTDGWTDGTNECQYGTVPLSVCESSVGHLGTMASIGRVCGK